jgi:hypothetical protein
MCVSDVDKGDAKLHTISHSTEQILYLVVSAELDYNLSYHYPAYFPSKLYVPPNKGMMAPKFYSGCLNE